MRTLAYARLRWDITAPEIDFAAAAQSWRHATAERAASILGAGLPIADEARELLVEELSLRDRVPPGETGGWGAGPSADRPRAIVLGQNPFRMRLFPPPSAAFHFLTRGDLHFLWLAELVSRAALNAATNDGHVYPTKPAWMLTSGVAELGHRLSAATSCSVKHARILNVQSYRYYTEREGVIVVGAERAAPADPASLEAVAEAGRQMVLAAFHQRVGIQVVVFAGQQAHSHHGRFFERVEPERATHVLGFTMHPADRKSDVAFHEAYVGLARCVEEDIRRAR